LFSARSHVLLDPSTCVICTHNHSSYPIYMQQPLLCYCYARFIYQDSTSKRQSVSTHTLSPKIDQQIPVNAKKMIRMTRESNSLTPDPRRTTSSLSLYCDAPCMNRDYNLYSLAVTRASLQPRCQEREVHRITEAGVLTTTLAFLVFELWKTFAKHNLYR
jgi:hypothetical protein